MHRPGTRPSGPCRNPPAVVPSPLAATRGRRLGPLALLLCPLIAAHRSPAQQPSPRFILAAELPNAPTPQLSAQTAPAQTSSSQTVSGTVSGAIVDRDGASIAGARITLTSDSEPPTSAPHTAITAADGRFSFSNIPPGPFKLTVAAAGFVPRQTSGELHDGEIVELPAIAMLAGANTAVQVTATQTEIAEAQINEEEKQRIFYFIPNFYVSYLNDPIPLNPRQKFELAYKTLIDPVSLVLNGITAGVQQATDTYSWGEGAQGYAKRYAAAYGTFMTGTVLGSAALPILLKQDPRYFYKGTGSVRSRFDYAVANAVICKGDNHRWQVNYSAIFGSIAAGAISNFYYPAVNRSGVGLTFEGAAIGTGISAVSNIFQEFLIKKLTPHIPPNPPANP